MFGLDKIFGGGGGIFGKFFDSMGLGWLGKALSLATNVMTGNWLAAAKDVFELVSQFSSNSWMDQASRFQPLGEFGQNSPFGTESFSGARADELSTRADSFDPLGQSNSTRAIYVVRETTYNNAVANRNLAYAHASQRA